MPAGSYSHLRMVAGAGGSGSGTYTYTLCTVELGSPDTLTETTITGVAAPADRTLEVDLVEPLVFAVPTIVAMRCTAAGAIASSPASVLVTVY